MVPGIPFLVMHGAIVAASLVILATVAGAGLMWRIRKPRSLRAKALALAVCGAASYGALFGVGHVVAQGSARPRLAPTAEPRTASTLPGFDAVAIAAALPGARGKALDLLLDRVRDTFVRTADTREMAYTLARLTGGCAREAHWLLSDALPDRALAVATACGDAESLVQSYLRLGRYADASAYLLDHRREDDDVQAMRALIAVSRWNEAASRVDEFARELAKRRGLPVSDNGPLANLRCFTELLRVRGETPGASERLAALARTSGSVVCEQIAALATGDVEAIRRASDANALEVRSEVRSKNYPLYAKMRRIAWSYGALADQFDEDPARPLDSDGTTVSWLPGPGEATEALWLAPFALAARDTATNRKWMAAYHAYVGDFAAARRDITAVRATFPDEDLELAVELHLGEPMDERAAAAFTKLASHASLPPLVDEAERRRDAFDEGFRRATRASAAVDADDRTCRQSIDPAFRAAFDGDGRPLATLFRTCPDSLERLPLRRVLAILPRVSRHLDELRAQLTIVPGTSKGISVFDLLELAMRRDLMRISGDTVRAVQWQTIIDNHARIFEDRDRVIALMWLEIL